MPTFKYTALNLDGTKITGIEECASKNALNSLLEEKSLLLLSCSKSARQKDKAAQASAKKSGGKKIPIDDLILFTRQFSTMFRVGVPLLRILYILKDQVENNHLQRVVACIAKDVEDGAALADAFRKHPKVFPPIYCSMLAAGETSGNISIVMDKLCGSIEYESEVKNLIKGALQYPIIVMIALAVAFAILMGFVIPSFVPLFDSLGGEIPAITKVCIGISNVFTHYWYIILGVIAALFVGLSMTRKHPRGRLALSKFALGFPLIGKLLDYSYMARFGSLFAILQSSGILVVDALQIIGNCIANSALRNEIATTAIDVEAGKSISASLQNSHYFPRIMQSMIAIGEASGNLEEMLNEAARHFEVEVHHAVKKLTGALGPFLIINMAIGVGFFAMAIYLPIWNMTELQMAQ